ncbi:MAG TPA: 5-demethoxyubiquinol-8 5-hydroxylase UbiM [Dyella sp.]|uniref:5-demethoxyubiquinol-8 5-hydroxylase UbiM n=1 Tax=Dyella sp. TaxID=1869338 RepID=UPI002D799FDF|nr:5-demethoxyubiquinol-8 5-hydroxylase UbiM [Dyella sp.]HET6553454.1 5-demethoxyubiquinol-8 5-hydroxylase UbiM [Dyella sp.]
MQVDVVIVGAGPAGLCLARALAPTGLSVVVVEQQPLGSLREPAFDGREIALTRRSVRILRELGVWERLGPPDISPLRRARVLNGSSLHGLSVAPAGDDDAELAFLVPNDRIRRAAYACVEHEPRVTLVPHTAVHAVSLSEGLPRLHLSSGDSLTARLAVAADSRFSSLRREVGIPADMHDFGKSMLVCRMALERSHDGEALEWFDHGQTLALLPLHNGEASVVLTLPGHAMKAVMALDDAAFNKDMHRRFDGRFGQMRLTSTRHTYPLVATYARRFVAPNIALIGDAAVGMHPVTAHGFNLGLLSVESLAAEIRKAHAAGEDFASIRVLERYQRNHRLATRPLYLATLAIAKLYTDDRLPARLARRALLRASQATPPFQRALARMLSADGPAGRAKPMISA